MSDGFLIVLTLQSLKITLDYLFGSVLMTKRLSSIHRIYKSLFKCWCYSLYILVCYSPFLGVTKILRHTNFYNLVKAYIIQSHSIQTIQTIQSQHLSIFFMFCQFVGSFDYLQDNSHLEALDLLLNSMM